MEYVYRVYKVDHNWPPLALHSTKTLWPTPEIYSSLWVRAIWGLDVIKCVTDDSTKYLNCISKFTAETRYMSFATFVLGVHKKSPKLAFLGELECYPLGLEITGNSIPYLQHLVSEKENARLKEAVLCNSTSQTGKSSSCKVDNIWSYVYINDNLLVNRSPSINRRSISQHLKYEFRMNLHAKIQAESKWEYMFNFSPALIMRIVLKHVPMNIAWHLHILESVLTTLQLREADT